MRRAADATLRAKLLLLALFAVIPAFALAIFSDLEDRATRVTNARNGTQKFANTVAENYQDFIIQSRELLSVLGVLRGVQLNASADFCRQFLTSVLSRNSTYVDLGVVRPNGDLFCNAGPVDTSSGIAGRSCFRDAIANRSFAVGTGFTGPISHKRNLMFVQPVLDSSGSVVELVFAAVDLSLFERMFGNSGLPPGALLTVFDDRGRVFARFPTDKPGVARPIADQFLFQTLLAQRGTGTVRLVSQTGMAEFAAFSTLGDAAPSRLYVAVEVSESAVLGRANRLLARNLLSLSIAALAVLAAAWWLSEFLIMRRVRSLIVETQRLSRGDFSVRIAERPGNDELGKLGAAFGAMAKTLESRDRAYRTLSEGNRILVHATEEHELLRDMCRVAVDMGGYRMAWVGYLEHDEAKSVRPMAYAGFEQGLLNSITVTWSDGPLGRGPTGIAIRTGKPFASGNIRDDAIFDAWRVEVAARGYQSCIALPLNVGEERLGNLTIYAAEPGVFGAEETQLLSELAGDLSFGIAVLRTRKKERETERWVRHLAFHDALTGLPNRTQFHESVAAAIAAAVSDDEPFAVLALSVDNLREINGALGYAQGDDFLKAIAERLTRMTDDCDRLARLAENRFAILMRGHTVDDAARAAQSILQAIEAPFEVAGLQLDALLSVGIALFPSHGRSAEVLIRRADMAVQEAHRKGSPYTVDPESAISEYSARRLQLGGELRRGIASRQLLLHYQIKVDIESNRICGAEGLVRWNHPARGMTAPSEFIPLAEHTGLIKPLTYAVMDMAIEQIGRFARLGLTVPIAVNLSARNLRDPDLVDRVRSALVAAKVAPGRLEFEITESALMEDPEGARRSLADLHELGIRLYIDDYGTGYSSLAYLQKLPVHAIKIDQSFVFDMISSRSSASIVRSTIDLAHDLGLKVVAEGVENQETLDRLAEQGCDVAQGYFLGEPVDSERLVQICDGRGII